MNVKPLGIMILSLLLSLQVPALACVSANCVEDWHQGDSRALVASVTSDTHCCMPDPQAAACCERQPTHSDSPAHTDCPPGCDLLPHAHPRIGGQASSSTLKDAAPISRMQVRLAAEALFPIRVSYRLTEAQAPPRSLRLSRRCSWLL
jgi:hypothetical protein